MGDYNAVTGFKSPYPLPVKIPRSNEWGFNGEHDGRLSTPQSIPYNHPNERLADFCQVLARREKIAILIVVTTIRVTAMPSQHPGRGGHCPREPTQKIRIPLNRVTDVCALIRPDTEQSAALFGTVGDYTLLTPTDYPTPRACTLYQSRVAAGFPSPADDDIEGQLDLNRYLVDRPAATFFIRVEGDSMLGAGIHPGDLLVVDRSRQAGEGSVIIAVLDGELTVKRLRYRGEQAWLYPENEAYPPLAITDAHDFQIWGVVRHVVHSF